ncbi:sensor histidine kinase [Microcella flavibacter]|uniref:sensor histidine kinase n=1 Tax=Microcella flavibacter TaxID=1804990 RepID=UPI001457732E|nr:hypothetical protein [Microcella flavibacter]
MASITLPRDVAASTIVRGVATAGRAVLVAGQLTAAALTVDVFVDRGAGPALPLVLAPILTALLLSLLLLARPGLATAALFLGGAGVASTAYVVLGMQALPSLDDPSPYLLNRIGTGIALVGAVRGSARSGILWTIAGTVVGHGSVALGLLIADRPVEVGLGPVLTGLVLVLVYVVLAIARVQAKRRIPDLDALQRDLEATERRGALEARSAAVIHDTVLADLAAVAARSGPIDDRLRASLRSDLALAGRPVAIAEEPSGSLPPHQLSAELLELAGQYAWRGLTVQLSGVETLAGHPIDDRRAGAVMGAARAALDNVVAHAGTDNAEVVVGVRDQTLAVLVVDDGRGFDAVDADRLGVRGSIRTRVEAVGGSVRLWSGPEGTTVMMSVPLEPAELDGSGARP